MWMWKLSKHRKVIAVITRFWGRKIGMTQVFVGDKLVPVTAIDLADWVVTQIKRKEHNGYAALQLGHVKDRYAQQAFSPEWLKKPKTYFLFIKEVPVDESTIDQFQVGQKVDFISSSFTSGDKVDVVGITKGAGFAGVVRRHGFAGAPGSHGSNMGKRPGSSSSYRRQGRIIKGKRFPGHMGVVTRMMKHLEVVKLEQDGTVLLIKGSVPGKSGSLLSVIKL